MSQFNKPTSQSRIIKADYLARVEGEGALHLTIQNQTLTDVKLKIFEPPRFFEGLLRGRAYTEAPDITARICGICPVAYQMSAIQAMENAAGIVVSQAVHDLRRLFYCGEWISSHALHIYMLHAPDFLGYPSAIEMAKDHRAEVTRGLSLKRTGNDIMRIVGGREIHPINARVGGFYQLPTRQQLAPLRQRLEAAAVEAEATLAWSGTFIFPEFEQDYTFVALRHDHEYPMNAGRIHSNRGLNIDVAAFETHFAEEQVSYSTALHSKMIIEGGCYHVGPLARYALNFDRLPAEIQAAAIQAGLEPVCTNPFKSICVRAIEVLYAVREAIAIIDRYTPEDTTLPMTEPASATMPFPSTGFGATEAPRGLLYHRYEIAADGLITHANIVPPTAQNQSMIESDLSALIPRYLERSDVEIQLIAEQAIRNYDPCISCSTHFLNLNIQRT